MDLTPRNGAVMSVGEHLSSKGIQFFHATNLREFVCYLDHGALLSRERLLADCPGCTEFWSDPPDRKLGVLDRVFGNLYDFGRIFARARGAAPNIYGPITMLFAPSVYISLPDLVVTEKSVATLRETWRASAVSDAQLADVTAGDPFPGGDRAGGIAASWQSAEASFGTDSVPLDRLVKVIVEPVQVEGEELIALVREEMIRAGYRHVPAETRAGKYVHRLQPLIDMCADLNLPPVQETPKLPDELICDLGFEGKGKHVATWCRYFCYGTRDFVRERWSTDNEDEQPIWEDSARAVLKEALSDAEWDEDEQAITVRLPDAVDGDWTSESFANLEALRRALVDIVEVELAANGPREDGEFVFDIDGTDMVNEALEEHGITSYFNE